MNETGKIGFFVILVLVCLLSVQEIAKAEKEQDSEALKKIENTNSGTVVYSTKDAFPGTILSSKDLAVKLLPLKKIPGNTLSKVEQGIGRKLKREVSKGQLVNIWDLECEPHKVVQAVKFIGKNQIVTKQHVKEVWIKNDPRPFPGVARDSKLIIGKKALQDIDSGVYLSEEQFK